MNSPREVPSLHVKLVLVVTGSLLATYPASAQPTTTSTPSPAPANGEETVVLSPFEVDASKDIGYYAESTLAGSRLNTNLGDLAASITVVTKQQLQDTASVDINDVFLYEANTEGTGNYTDFSVDTRGAAQDRVAGFQGGAPSLPSTPYTANRVRGIPGSVDKLRDYYSGSTRLPWDSYNTDSVEINRGPNSILFGLGSPSGLVNQSTTRASLGNRSAELQLRAGSWGSHRASVSLNQPLIADKLGFFAAALYEDKGYPRKPSQDITRRQFLAFTYKPWPKTTLRANVEHYSNYNRRPNSLTPRDFVSPWIAAGRPTYNPVTGILTKNGTTSGPYDGSVGASGDALMAASENTLSFDGNTRPVLEIEQGQELAYVMRQLSSTPTDPNVPAQFTFNRPERTTKSLGPLTRQNIITGRPAGILYQQPGVIDKSIYDWDKINIISGNFGKDRAYTYNAEFEQEIIPHLDLQLGWYLEDFKSDDEYYISQQTGVTLYVDTNEVNLDGSPNPNLGRPFIEITQPDGFLQPEKNSTTRGTLAYELDFTKNDGWSKWLGHHRIMGLLQRQQIRRQQLRYRPLITTNTLFTPVVANVWSGNTVQNAIERRFYVGDSTGHVTEDPGLYPNGTRENTLHWLNPATDTWTDTSVTVDTDLHFVSNQTRQGISSRAVALQSYFLDDRVIATVGWRRDESSAANSNFLGIRSDGRTDRSTFDVFTDPQVVTGNTKTYGVVAKPLPWLSFHYNRSDNFQPAGFSTDFFNNPLPLPTGEGRDYGIGVALLGENKLTANLNWFKTTQDQSRSTGVPGQVFSRTITVDDTFLRTWAQWVTGSASNNSPEVNAILQLPDVLESATPGTFFGIPVAGTSTVEAKGLEFQLTYNPRRNWTMKFNAARQETTYTNIIPEWDSWVATRMPIWTSTTTTNVNPLTGATFTDFWHTTGQDLQNSGLGGVGLGATQTVEDWWNSNVAAVASPAKKNEGKVTQDQRKWRFNYITNYQFMEGPLNGLGLGGAVRWEDKAAIGYLAAPPEADGVIRDLDVDQPVFDDSQTHLDLWLSYTINKSPFGDNLRTKLQFNVRDALDGGELQPIAINPDGNPVVYRIDDGRTWYLTATFDF